MSQPWQQGSAARQPGYDDSSVSYAPAARRSRQSRQPYAPPVSSAPPAAAPLQQQPSYMQPQAYEQKPLTPGVPYGADAYYNGPQPYPQAFGQPEEFAPVQEAPLRDPFTPAVDPKPLKKIREDQLPQRQPVRVGRVLCLIAALVMIVFCTLATVRMVLTKKNDDANRLAAAEQYREETGYELQHMMARVDLLPEGQTYEPTASPTPEARLSTPTPPPVIAFHEAAALDLDDREKAEETAEATEAPVLRTKLTAYPKNPMNNVQESLSELIGINPEVIGRLVIPGLIDEVVVQRNNTYYLTHSYTGAGSNAGSVFADESCSLRMPPENLLLRGQSDVGGKTFAPLWQYVSGGTSFAASHATARLTTLYEEESYVLFAVVLSDSDPKSPGYFNYASHPTFATDTAMLSYVQSARERSLYPFSVEVIASDRLLTLSTLGSGNQTVVLIYRMARDGENY